MNVVYIKSKFIYKLLKSRQATASLPLLQNHWRRKQKRFCIISRLPQLAAHITVKS